MGWLVRETLDVDERDEIDEEEDCCGWVDGTLGFPSKLNHQKKNFLRLFFSISKIRFSRDLITISNKKERRHRGKCWLTWWICVTK